MRKIATRHADADLLRPPGDRVGHHPVQADGREQQRQRADGCRSPDDEPRLAHRRKSADRRMTRTSLSGSGCDQVIVLDAERRFTEGIQAYQPAVNRLELNDSICYSQHTNHRITVSPLYHADRLQLVYCRDRCCPYLFEQLHYRL